MQIPSLDAAQEPDWLLGGATYLMLVEPESWIYRRVESIGILDSISFRRRVSVDLVPPTEDFVGYEPVPVIPLALLQKQVLINFDLVDESGATVPLLTRGQNSFVAWSALARIAQIELEEEAGEETPLSETLLADLKVIASAGGSVAAATIASLDTKAKSDRQWAVLRNSAFFMDLARDLAAHFLLLAPLESEPGTRRVLKFSYAQELEQVAGKKWSRFVARMGWGATQLDFQTPSVGQAKSYHFEMAPPPGLAVAVAQLRVEDVDTEPVDLPAERAGNRVHAYAADTSAVAAGAMSVWLWPVRAGLVRTGAATSLVTTAVLLFFLLTNALDEVSGDVAAAILLTIPGLIAAFIVRPGEHSMVTDMMLGIRYQIAFCGLTAYAAALSALGGFSPSTLRITWTVLTVLSCLALVSLVVGYIGIPPPLSVVGDDAEVESGDTNG